MKDVFDQHNDMDDNGNVTGGDGKLLCLQNWKLNKTMVRTLVNTPCRNIIEKLRKLFRDVNQYADRGDGSDSDDSVSETKRQEATGKLNSSEWILAMINEYLSIEWDVDHDGSLHKTVLCLDSAAGRIRRKRKALDGNEDKMTAQRRRGRLPPRTPRAV